MQDVLIKERLYAHSIDKIWKAITEGKEISKWFIAADFKPEVGYRYTLTATEEHGCTQINGTVLEVNPYTLRYTWVVGDSQVITNVCWTLEKEGVHTRLRIEHSGISQYKGESAVEMFGSFSNGWDFCMDGLVRYMKDGKTAPAH